MSIGVAAVQTQKIIYLGSLGIAGFLFLCVFFYCKRWEQKTNEAKERTRSTNQETKALQERYGVRAESLNHLERQVSGFVKLFEMARDLNECLSFTILLSVIDQKVSREISFARGTLILIDTVEQSSTQAIRSMVFGPEKRTNTELSDSFSAHCVKLLNSVTEIVKIESANDPLAARFEAYKVQFPIWIFPLMVEHKLIAVLALEGGITNDFPKYEILASQLALQVKKIRLYETVKEISIIDGLTQVFVRRHFLDRFHEELGRAFRYRFPLSVLMVDVDHFKSYNDNYGHLVGDKALREVAQVIRENIRRVDVLGRYGGEEFIIVAPEIDKAKGMELAERIRSAVAHKQFRLYDEEMKVTVSIGVSSFPEDLAQEKSPEPSEEDLFDLINKADQALYRAKEEGRNRVLAYHL